MAPAADRTLPRRVIGSAVDLPGFWAGPSGWEPHYPFFDLNKSVPIYLIYLVIHISSPPQTFMKRVDKVSPAELKPSITLTFIEHLPLGVPETVRFLSGLL